MNRPRVARLMAAGLAVFLFGAALAACGSDGPSNAEVAGQDRDVVAGNKVDDANLAKLKESLRVLWLKRARARQAAAAAARRNRPRPIPAPTVIVGGTRVSTVDVCAPVRRRFGGRAGRADRQWRLMQRRRALSFLNLRC